MTKFYNITVFLSFVFLSFLEVVSRLKNSADPHWLGGAVADQSGIKKSAQEGKSHQTQY